MAGGFRAQSSGLSDLGCGCEGFGLDASSGWGGLI